LIDTGRCRKSGYFILTVAGLAAFAACGDSSVEPDGRIVEGVDLDQLFAEPGQAEIDAILADWAARDVSAKDVTVEVAESITIGGSAATLSVVSHTVGGVKHYGAILVPAGAQPGTLPVLVYAHGGDGGIDIDGTLSLLPFVLGSDLQNYVFVAPSFRAEPLFYNDVTYLSDGPPSPWDRDVDDALALVNAVLATTLEADAQRIAVIGFSRGAGVGLLMAERDPRIDIVVEFFGPTDFFGTFVQDVVEEALRGNPRDLPGLDFLDTEFIQPLKNGALTVEDVRPEIVRRSAVLFAERLSQLQVHHGTDDQTVEVSQAQSLIDVMLSLGYGAPEFEYFLYEGGTHDPLSLPGSLDHTRDFLSRLLSVAPMAAGAL
jgi:dipeptidyl aminopeptidase/acylaminoacyl peptidase